MFGCALQLEEYTKKLQQGAEYVQKLQGYLDDTSAVLDDLKAQQQVSIRVSVCKDNQ